VPYELTRAAAVAVFLLTYLAISVGRFPGLRLDRAGIALAGSACMIGCGAIPLSEAYRAIDFDTIALLLGMMIVVASLRLSGFFRLVSTWVASRARHPLLLLCAVVGVSGLLSAFLVNDAVCLALTPLVLETVVRLRRDPVPYLLGVAMAANVGGAATITGNPQNMIIGSFAHIPYATFTRALAPVAIIGLLVTVAAIALSFRREFRAGELAPVPALPQRVNRPLVLKALVISLAMIVGLFLGLPPAGMAIGAAVLTLLTRRVKPEKIYAHIDWTLLLMFCGLFIVVAGLERAVLTGRVLAGAAALHLEHKAVLVSATAVLSNIVSNVPAVMVLRPFVSGLPDPQRAWLLVAMAATLAGNFTIVGSVANLIVVQRARAQGVEIGFWRYFTVGGPLTLLTLLIGALWL
jgi:Na+/H+ antiporter NhaD/arsenite permease-like protein